MRVTLGLLFLLPGIAAATVDAQVPLDRADPGIATRELPRQPKPAARPAPTIAAPSPQGMIATPAGVAVRVIVVEGAPDIAAAEFAAVTSSFTGHRLSADDLRDLLVTVSGVARARGYIFARSSIAAQALSDGVLRIRLDEGHIDEIRITGAQDGAVQAMLAPLSGHAPRKQEVERRLTLAGDLPGVAIGNVSYVREGGRGVLIVPVTRNRIGASAYLDNRGVRELGPLRAQLGVDFNGLFGTSDVLTAQTLFTPAQPRELTVVSARYAVRPDNSGTEVALTGSYARTHSGGDLKAYDVTGESVISGISITRPLLRRRKTSLWVAGEFDYLAIDQRVFGDLARRDRLATASLTLNGYTPLGPGRLRGAIGVTQGIDALGSTDPGDPRASRPDADGRFTSFSLSGNWQAPIVGRFSATLAMQAQLSTRPLLAVEQIQIGGPLFGRAYDYSERSGDEGILGSAELQYKLLEHQRGLLRYVQLYGFGDAGHVTNLREDFGAGTLYSAGFGTRVSLPAALRLGLEAAFPLNADRFSSDDRDPRISFSVAKAF